MAIEIILREAYKMKGFIILMGPKEREAWQATQGHLYLNFKKIMHIVCYLFTKPKNRLNY